ncbi:hypothetical protein [Tranquillimonas alkanivorans]|uniref:Uncharacterized protein n=1 Tax=Tranquillimonas alkanivorans TaxID=441119 RepID=A0A1I5Q6Z5_9RHOB|nr:hypothetical protein [Tranquillimonas alkanivorans]SFP41656.1 hypothetical protein SAMN04488047_10683 [Tranquillimonas alkanivorans]
MHRLPQGRGRRYFSNSGYGREHGGFAMKGFVDAKSIYLMD